MKMNVIWTPNGHVSQLAVLLTSKNPILCVHGYLAAKFQTDSQNLALWAGFIKSRLYVLRDF